MTRFMPVTLLLCLSAGPLARTSTAGVIPIIWGHGESVTHLGKLPAEAEQAVARELGVEVSVGFLYSHCHVYYADLWTWNGTHVLYNGEKYWTPDAAGWQQMLGESVETKYGKPFLYRFPLGILLICALVSACGFKPLLFPSDEQRLKRILQNPAYAAALEGVLPPDKYPFRADCDEREFELAVDSLIAGGISADKARANLRFLADATILQRASQLAAAFQVAQQLAAMGQTAQAISALEHVAAALPPTDPRQQYVSEQLSKLREPVTAPAVAANPGDDAAGLDSPEQG